MATSRALSSSIFGVVMLTNLDAVVTVDTDRVVHTTFPLAIGKA